MKKALWTIGIIAVVVAVALGTHAGQKGAGTAGDLPETIKIGVISPFTGDAASYGEAVKNGAVLAIEDINAHGGIAGKKLEAVYEDSKCSGKDALSAAQKLVDADHVNALVGAICSSEVLGVLPLTESKPMIFLGLGSSPDITGKGKYFFRTWPSDTLSSKAMVDKLVPEYKKIAVITEKTDYAVALGKAFEADTKSAGGEIVFSESFAGTTKDFRSILSKAKLANPEVLFINAQTGQNVAAIANQARDLGIKAQFVVYFFTGDEFVKAGSAVNGTLILDNPSLDESRSVSKQYEDAYKARFNTISYPFVGAQVYDQIHLLAKGIEKNGLDANKLKDFFNTTSYSGVIGDYSFDNNGDVIGVGFSFKKVEDGKLVNIK